MTKEEMRERAKEFIDSNTRQDGYQDITINDLTKEFSTIFEEGRLAGLEEAALIAEDSDNCIDFVPGYGAELGDAKGTQYKISDAIRILIKIEKSKQ